LSNYNLQKIIFCPHHLRLEASWCAGGFDLDARRRNTLEKSEGLKELLTWPVDRRIRYIGKPVLQLRTKQPLQPILDIEQSKNEKLEVPIHNLDPRVKGIGTERSYQSNIPGP
jgi:Mitochondrial 28S ribosomal protein S30 (PDCD9)